MRGRGPMARRLIGSSVLAVATLALAPAVAAQDGDTTTTEWSGDLTWTSDTVTQLGPATITITRDAGTDDFSAVVDYGTTGQRRFQPPNEIDPRTCTSNTVVVFEGSGTFSPDGTRLVLSGQETSTQSYPDCGDLGIADDGEVRTGDNTLNVDLTGDTLDGTWAYSEFSLPGPVPVPLAGPGGADSGGEAAAAGDGDGTPADDASEESGDGSSSGLLIGGLLVVIVAVGGAVVVSRARRARPTAGTVKGETDEVEEKERRVSLELTFPAGASPKVFSSGWVFGARCTVEDENGSHDHSQQVHWSASGESTCSPPVGPLSRPTWTAPAGPQEITLQVTVDGTVVERTFPVVTVDPRDYAGVGYRNATCASCAHGCPACPHSVIGPFTTGSTTVTTNGVPASRVGDVGIHAACCGSNTWEVVDGDPEVLIDGRPAAKVGSTTRHCGGSAGRIA